MSSVYILHHLSKSVGRRDGLWKGLEGLALEGRIYALTHCLSETSSCESDPKNQNLPFVAPKEAHRVRVLHRGHREQLCGWV